MTDDDILKLWLKHEGQGADAILRFSRLLLSSEWQPISTAPKDRELILFCPRFGIQCPGEWRKDEYAKTPRPYWTSSAELLLLAREQWILMILRRREASQS